MAEAAFAVQGFSFRYRTHLLIASLALVVFQRSCVIAVLAFHFPPSPVDHLTRVSSGVCHLSSGLGELVAIPPSSAMERYKRVSDHACQNQIGCQYVGSAGFWHPTHWMDHGFDKAQCSTPILRLSVPISDPSPADLKYSLAGTATSYLTAFLLLSISLTLDGTRAKTRGHLRGRSWVSGFPSLVAHI